MTNALSDQQVRAYEEQGYLCPVRVLDDAKVKYFLDHYNAYIARNQARLDGMKTAAETFAVLSETHFAMKWAYELVTQPRVLDAVERILGPNILAWNTNWFSKKPNSKTFVSWHQDGTYWNLVPPTVVTAWIALTPCAPANGCMRVVPGTHKTQFLPQRDTYNKDNALSRGQEIAVEVDEKKAADLCLQPGEMSLHHIWIVHGSGPNTSNTPRIGLAVRYTKPEVKQESPGKPLAMLVRGRDMVGNFELMPAPTSDEPPVEVHTQIVKRIRESIMVAAKK